MRRHRWEGGQSYSEQRTPVTQFSNSIPTLLLPATAPAKLRAYSNGVIVSLIVVGKLETGRHYSPVAISHIRLDSSILAWTEHRN